MREPLFLREAGRIVEVEEDGLVIAVFFGRGKNDIDAGHDATENALLFVQAWEQKHPYVRPCPFCGNETLLTKSIGGPGLPYYVYCFRCRADGPNGDTEQEAIDRWNGTPRKQEVEED